MDDLKKYETDAAKKHRLTGKNPSELTMDEYDHNCRMRTRADTFVAFATALWPDILPWQAAALRAIWEKERPIGGTSSLADKTPDEAVAELVGQLDEQRAFVEDFMRDWGARPARSGAVIARIRKHADAIEALHEAMRRLLVVVQAPKAEPPRDTPQYWQDAYFMMQAQIDQLRQDMEARIDHADSRTAALEASGAERIEAASELAALVSELENAIGRLTDRIVQQEAKARKHDLGIVRLDERVAELGTKCDRLTDRIVQQESKTRDLVARHVAFETWSTRTCARLTTLSATVDRLAAGAVWVSKDTDPSAPAQCATTGEGGSAATGPEVTAWFQGAKP